MIYLLGANGNIGTNLSNFFKFKGISYKGVSRLPSNSTICFSNFLKILTKNKNILIINAAKFNDTDLNLLKKSAKKCTRIIHISSVAVYGNCNLSNTVLPINKYGRRKVLEESFFRNNFSVFIIRLSNIYGGTPETSGVLNSYYSGNLNYIEISEKKMELLRDYVPIDELFKAIYDNLDFSNTQIINVSTGIGMTSTEFFSSVNLDITKIKRQLYNRNNVIKISIIDNYYKSKY